MVSRARAMPTACGLLLNLQLARLRCKARRVDRSKSLGCKATVIPRFSGERGAAWASPGHHGEASPGGTRGHQEAANRRAAAHEREKSLAKQEWIHQLPHAESWTSAGITSTRRRSHCSVGWSLDLGELGLAPNYSHIGSLKFWFWN